MPSYFGGAAGSRLVLLVFHPLLRDEQHGRCNHQPAADQIEDRGADAAGRGQSRTCFVQNLDDAGAAVRTIRNLTLFRSFSSAIVNLIASFSLL